DVAKLLGNAPPTEPFTAQWVRGLVLAQAASAQDRGVAPTRFKCAGRVNGQLALLKCTSEDGGRSWEVGVMMQESGRQWQTQVAGPPEGAAGDLRAWLLAAVEAKALDDVRAGTVPSAEVTPVPAGGVPAAAPVAAESMRAADAAKRQGDEQFLKRAYREAAAHYATATALWPMHSMYRLAWAGALLAAAQAGRGANAG
ncbi:MAG: hypothetical protein ACK4IB_11825, partial [Erythrobacter sp.]